MRVVDIIQKKRDKQPLSDAEIRFLLENYLSGDVPDYQLSAFLMAVYFNGMNDEELFEFTDVMMNSGDLIDFAGINRFLIDKHSTGGVGDKTSIALAPLLSAFGIGTAKLSGKGLGHTGGTIDKFESIAGFSFPQTREELVNVVNSTGIGIMGYSDSIVPLDKQLYALRDVTGTVPSIPLIASSIMSKKLAVHADGIILDVKVGNGAFMKDIDQAKKLADTMLRIGKRFDRNIMVVLSNMDQPLGNAVGNSLEVIEAIETLKGLGPEDFTELVVTLAGIALLMKKDVKTLEEGIEKANDMINSDVVLDNLKAFIKACGGDEKIVNDYTRLPIGRETREVVSMKEGYIHRIMAEDIGKAAMILGAGRATKDDVIDHGVGVVLRKKVGDTVQTGESLATIYYNDMEHVDSANKMILGAYKVEPHETSTPLVIKEILK
ncbi:thymidine phosphorylase [Limibacter armeniacum]|uniref:thymidine phosphorylase n=1 Tax=Limibacter armeniacum TaxID=466084 RepID=UPI002FE5FDF5